MAKDREGNEAAPPRPTAPTAPNAPPQIQLDESKVSAAYANFCRVTGTPEEVLLDFGLNPEPMGYPKNPVKISERIVLNYFTAKRLLLALNMSVKRHEEAFGPLEIDIQKRITAAHRTAQE